ncbi:DUF6207 family protein [Streptomyces sp. YKOK-I1]
MRTAFAVQELLAAQCAHAPASRKTRHPGEPGVRLRLFPIPCALTCRGWAHGRGVADRGRACGRHLRERVAAGRLGSVHRSASPGCMRSASSWPTLSGRGHVQGAVAERRPVVSVASSGDGQGARECSLMNHPGGAPIHGSATTRSGRRGWSRRRCVRSSRWRRARRSCRWPAGCPT